MAPLTENTVQEVAAEGEEVQEVAAEGEEVQEVELTPEQKEAQLSELMSAGKRELIAGNFEAASEKFGEAAEFSAANYGEFAAESFEPNFMYGRSMVEFGAIENDMFKNALLNIKKRDQEDAKEDEVEEADGNESMTEEEKEEVRDLVADALAENAETLEGKGEETESTEEEEAKEEVKAEDKKEEEKTEKADDEEKVEEVKEEEKKVEETKDEEKTEESEVEKKTEEKEANGEAATEEKMEETEEKKGDEEAEAENGEQMETEESAEKEDIGEEEEDGEDEEEEELPSSQLAWESLEVASKIADKMYEETKLDDWKRKKADVLIQLAQCTANDEKYELALEDLGKARELLTEIESAKGDRLFAEICFHEGRIHRLQSDFKAAAEAFNKAAAATEVTKAVVAAAAADAPSEDQKKEMAELDDIIKDFKERAEDSVGSAVSKKMVEEMVKEEKQPSILTTSNANSDATANDISSLVRKKRAHDETEVEGAAKKAKSEQTDEEKGDENIAV